MAIEEQECRVWNLLFKKTMELENKERKFLLTHVHLEILSEK